jgi:hypothetical protein
VTSSTVNVPSTFDFDYTLETRDGKQYMVLKNPMSNSAPSRIYIHLTNLFNGNELLGKFFNKTNRSLSSEVLKSTKMSTLAFWIKRCVDLQVNTEVSEEHSSALKMEAVCSSETVVSTHKLTWHYNPQYQHRKNG